jgi:mono/diheme cytochrome c family protein
MAAAPATNRSAKRSHRNRVSPCAAAAAALAILVAGDIPARADDAAVARGAYLAAAAGCDDCHTDSKNGGKPYAGGRLLRTTFGPIATPNITPDRETGIGGWSLKDFVRAMRFGIAPDGSHYVPAFPFSSFGKLTDSDLADLKAFLDSLKPVAQPVAGVQDIALATRARAAIGIAASTSTHPEPARNDDPVVARGRYLVETVGHCGDCHTPLTWLGAPDRDRYLAGSRGGLEGKKAPNITPDTDSGIGKWSEDDIASLLKDGGTPDGDFVGGSMAEIVRNTARLAAGDRRAIAVYLKTLPPKAFAKNR